MNASQSLQSKLTVILLAKRIQNLEAELRDVQDAAFRFAKKDYAREHEIREEIAEVKAAIARANS